MPFICTRSTAFDDRVPLRSIACKPARCRSDSAPVRRPTPDCSPQLQVTSAWRIASSWHPLRCSPPPCDTAAPLAQSSGLHFAPARPGSPPISIGPSWFAHLHRIAMITVSVAVFPFLIEIRLNVLSM